MKKILLILAVSTLAFGSCGNEKYRGDGDCGGMIWDFTCWDVVLTVEDEQGNDLLNKENPANLLEKITVSYRGKTFAITQSTGSDSYSDTRFNMPRPLAMRVIQDKEGTNYLTFGEFTPESKYTKEPLTIHWNEEASDKIEFDLFITWQECQPTVHKALYVNGKQANDKNLFYSFVK